LQPRQQCNLAHRNPGVRENTSRSGESQDSIDRLSGTRFGEERPEQRLSRMGFLTLDGRRSGCAVARKSTGVVCRPEHTASYRAKEMTTLGEARETVRFEAFDGKREIVKSQRGARDVLPGTRQESWGVLLRFEEQGLHPYPGCGRTTAARSDRKQCRKAWSNGEDSREGEVDWFGAR